MRNALFWSRYIKAVYLAEITLLREGALERVLPGFAEEMIDRDAEAAEEKAWEQLCEVAGPDSDPANLAEQARDAGVDRFLMLKSLRQALMNLFAVALHHLVEQQQLFLLRREMLPLAEQDQHALLKSREFITRSRKLGVDVTTLNGWDDLDELRHVANAVKHAEGQAVALLRSRRPDLFVAPTLRQTHPEASLARFSKVYKPLFGDDLYVSASDLQRYFRRALEFWNSYAESLERLARDDVA